MGKLDFKEVRPLAGGAGDEVLLEKVINKLIYNQNQLIAMIDNPFQEEAVAPTDEEIVKASEAGSTKENSIGMDLQSVVTVEEKAGEEAK